MDICRVLERGHTLRRLDRALSLSATNLGRLRSDQGRAAASRTIAGELVFVAHCRARF
jgi:hypothetical protein